MKLSRSKKTKFPAPTEYPLEEYFTVAGKPFFRFLDASNIPAGRSLAAFKFYLPLQTSCDEKFLKAYVTAQENVFSEQKISIEKLISLKNQLKDRLQWVMHPQHVMKFASVCYLGKDENPYTYDEAYNEKKMAFWVENATAHDFFLSEPIKSLVPVLTNAEFSFQNYSTVVLEEDLLFHQNLLDILSQNPNSAEDVSNISSAITQLMKLRNYVRNQQMNISSLSTSSIQLSNN